MKFANAQILVALAIVGLQAVLFDLSYGFEELIGDELPWHIDHLYHLYQVHVSAAFIDQGSITGFDPRFAGGQISGATMNLSAKAPAILTWLSAGSLTPEHVYKGYIAIAVISSPLFLSQAARILGSSISETLLVGVLGILIWWASYLNWYTTAGMVSYTWTAYLGIYMAAVFWQIFTAEKLGAKPFFFSLLASAAWWIHPYFPILVLFPLVPMLFSAAHAGLLRRLVGPGLAMAALILIINYPWLKEVANGDQINGGPFPFGHYQQEVAPLRPIWEALGRFGKGTAGAKLNPILLMGSVAGFVFSKGFRRWLTVGLIMAWIGSQLAAYLGAVMVVVAHIQPNRLAPVGYLLLIVPAGWGIAELGRRVNAALRPTLLRVWTIGALGLILGGLPLMETYREVTRGDHGRYGMAPPQFREASSLANWLVEVVRKNRPAGTRVLLEQSTARAFDGTHIAGYLALATDAEYIGGPYASDDIVNFKDGRLLGYEIGDLSIEFLMELLDLYGIGLIIVHSEVSRLMFSILPGAERVGECGPAFVFRRRDDPGPFLVGKGRVVSSAPGSLILDELEGEEVAVKYNYLKNLQTNPEVKIEPFQTEASPHSFIRLISPPARVEITSRLQK